MKVLNLEQGGQEWLDYRDQGVGASDAPAIMGVGFVSRNTLLKHKLTKHRIYQNPAMTRGKELEPAIKKILEKRHGTEYTNSVIAHSEYPWCFASFDGISQEFEKCIEIKCANEYDHRQALFGNVPDKYFPQTQHHFLVVPSLKEYKYVSYGGACQTAEELLLQDELDLIPADDLVEVVVKRDDKYIAALLEAELQFIEELLGGLVKDMPIEIIDPKWQMLFEMYKGFDEQEKHAKAMKEEYKNALIALAGDQSAYGKGGRLVKYTKKGNINTKKLAADLNIDLETYRGSDIDAWRITIEDDNEE